MFVEDLPILGLEYSSIRRTLITVFGDVLENEAAIFRQTRHPEHSQIYGYGGHLILRKCYFGVRNRYSWRGRRTIRRMLYLIDAGELRSQTEGFSVKLLTKFSFCSEVKSLKE